MGSRMGAKPVRAGADGVGVETTPARRDVVLWNRPSERAEGFAAEHGAATADSPAAAARDAEIVVSMVVDGPQVRDVLLDRPDSVAAAGSPGLLCVDCSTLRRTPALS